MLFTTSLKTHCQCKDFLPYMDEDHYFQQITRIWNSKSGAESRTSSLTYLSENFHRGTDYINKQNI